MFRAIDRSKASKTNPPPAASPENPSPGSAVESSNESNSGRSYKSVTDTSSPPPRLELPDDDNIDYAPGYPRLKPLHFATLSLGLAGLQASNWLSDLVKPSTTAASDISTASKKPESNSGLDTADEPHIPTQSDDRDSGGLDTTDEPHIPATSDDGDSGSRKRTADEKDYSLQSFLSASVSSELGHLLRAAVGVVSLSDTVDSEALRPLLRTADVLEEHARKQREQDHADTATAEGRSLLRHSPSTQGSTPERRVPPTRLPAAVSASSPGTHRQDSDDDFGEFQTLQEGVFLFEDHSTEQHRPDECLTNEAFASGALQGQVLALRYPDTPAEGSISSRAVSMPAVATDSTHIKPARDKSPRRKSSGGETKLPTSVPNDSAKAPPPRPYVEDTRHAEDVTTASVLGVSGFPPLRRQPPRPEDKRLTILKRTDLLPQGFLEGFTVPVPDCDRADVGITINPPSLSGHSKAIARPAGPASNPSARSKSAISVSGSFWDQFPSLDEVNEKLRRLSAPGTEPSKSESHADLSPPRHSPQAKSPEPRPSAEIPTVALRTGNEDHTGSRAAFFSTVAPLGHGFSSFSGGLDAGNCFLCKRPMYQIQFSPYEKLQGVFDREQEGLLNEGSAKSSSSSKCTVGRERGPLLWSRQSALSNENPLISSCAKCGIVSHKPCMEMDIRWRREDKRRPRCRNCHDPWF